MIFTGPSPALLPPLCLQIDDDFDDDLEDDDDLEEDDDEDEDDEDDEDVETWQVAWNGRCR